MAEDFVKLPVEGERKIVGWTDPPERSTSRRVRSTYLSVARALRESAGQWAQLEDRSSPSGAYQFALRVRLGHPAAFRPAGMFEGTYSGPSVWVRYVGNPDEEREAAKPPVELAEVDTTSAFTL